MGGVRAEVLLRCGPGSALVPGLVLVLLWAGSLSVRYLWGFSRIRGGVRAEAMRRVRTLWAELWAGPERGLERAAVSRCSRRASLWAAAGRRGGGGGAEAPPAAALGPSLFGRGRESSQRSRFTSADRFSSGGSGWGRRRVDTGGALGPAAPLHLSHSTCRGRSLTNMQVGSSLLP